MHRTTAGALRAARILKLLLAAAAITAAALAAVTPAQARHTRHTAHQKRRAKKHGRRARRHTHFRPRALAQRARDATAPSAPSSLAAAPGDQKVGLGWRASTDNVGVKGYRIYRNDVGIATVSASTLSFTDGPLTDGVSVSYVVRAYDRAGNLSPASNTVTATPTAPPATTDTTSPSAPSNLSATPGDSSVSLSWSASTDDVGVTRYDIYRNGGNIATVDGATRTYRDAAVVNGTSYSYYVTARDAAGNVSAGSTSVSATPAAATNTAVTWSNGWGTWDANHWPGWTWRPYADSAWVNQKYGDSTAYRSNSAQMVASVLSGESWRSPKVWVPTGANDWQHPYYFSHASDPVYTVHCTQYSCPSMEGQQVRIPSAARPAGGGDGHMTILDQSTGVEWDFWKASTPSGSGGTLNVASGGKLRIDGDARLSGSSANAAMTGLVAGPVRPEELLNGSIPHAIDIIAPTTNGTYVYPASKTAGGATAGAPPDGQLFKLDYTDAEIANSGLPAWKKAILTAAAHYGLYVTDTGGGTLHFVSQQTYASYGAAGWNALLGQPQVSGSTNNVTFDLATGVDWTRLRAVDPCVPDPSC
jgi:chitodextrinase